MPTPIGHALGALLLTAPLRARYRLGGTAAMVVAAAAIAPDLDLVVGRHSAETHSVGAAALATVATYLFLRSRARPRPALWASLVGAAVLSHTLLDWLGSDTSPPIGIMALWPFTRGYFESDAHVFMAVSRRYWLAEFWVYNLSVLARELLVVGISAAAAEWWVRRRR